MSIVCELGEQYHLDNLDDLKRKHIYLFLLLFCLF